MKTTLVIARGAAAESRIDADGLSITFKSLMRPSLQSVKVSADGHLEGLEQITAKAANVGIEPAYAPAKRATSVFLRAKDPRRGGVSAYAFELGGFQVIIIFVKE